MRERRWGEGGWGGGRDEHKFSPPVTLLDGEASRCQPCKRQTLAGVSPGLPLHPEVNLLSEGQGQMQPFHGLCPWTAFLGLSGGETVGQEEGGRS